VIRRLTPGEGAALFAASRDTLVWSTLQGIMGVLYGDGEGAMAVNGDFTFFAGTPSRALAAYRPEGAGPYRILVPPDRGWRELILEVYGPRATPITRYALKKEETFDRARLEEAAASLPAGYTLAPMDESLYAACKGEPWSADLVSQFHTWEVFHSLALGVAALEGETLVAGASTYSRYERGIEIEIDTREDRRRKGLAYACGAKLMLACLDRGLYPSWDAHNRASLALAEKLGYHLSHPYTAIEVREPQETEL